MLYLSLSLFVVSLLLHQVAICRGFVPPENAPIQAQRTQTMPFDGTELPPISSNASTLLLEAAPANCFSAFMTVLVQKFAIERIWEYRIQEVKMRDLTVGDRVHVGNDPFTGERIYEPVYAFGHRNPDHLALFMVLETPDQPELEITPRHLIYTLNTTHPVRADQLVPGHVLSRHQVADPAKAHYFDLDEPGMPIEAAPIHRIKEGVRRGIYQPLTKSGTIVVNNILCSTHDSPVHPPIPREFYQAPLLDEFVLENPLFDHLWMAPYRVVCSWGKFHCQNKTRIEWFSSSVPFSGDLQPHDADKEFPSLWWLEQRLALANRVYNPEDPALGLSRLRRYLLFGPILVFLCICVGIEWFKSSPVSPWLGLLGLVYFLAVLAKRGWEGKPLLQLPLWRGPIKKHRL